MAKEPPIYGLLWLFTLSYAVATASLSLGSQLSRFIPDCAQQCLLSFVTVNYGASTCGNEPSLHCLCAHAGASGFTIGEGALQCITAERAIGFCSLNEASDDVVDEALYMCNDQPGAVQPTHGIITATLVLPPPGGNGIVTVPFPETTSTLISTTTTTTTSKSTSTSTSKSSISFTHKETSTSTTSTSVFTLPSSTKFSSQTTIITTTTQTSATETNTATEIPAGAGSNNDGNNHDDSNPLSTGQVAGISVGVVAAAGVAVGAILLSRYCRRRKHPNVKTGFLPMRDTWGYKFDKGPESGSSSWIARQMQQPVEPDHLIPPLPRPYNHTSWRPDTIGLAISPPQYKDVERPAPAMRRLSRLLPAKPLLSLSLPRSNSPPLSQQVQNFTPSPWVAPASQHDVRDRAQPPAPPKLTIPKQSDLMAAPPAQYGRESTLTEFEEDGGMSLSSGGQVWRPPSSAPLSAGTYYVADKQGNWVLGDPKRASQIAELEAVTPWTAGPKTAEPKTAVEAPTSTRDALDKHGTETDSSQRPAPPPKEPRTTLAPPAEITRGVDFSRSSSVYSQQSNVPRPLFSSTSNARQSGGSIRRSLSRSLTRPRAASTDSGITTFTTDSEDTDDPSPPAEPPQQGNLSPVAESPGSGNGRSPVTYPKIPGREPGGVVRRPSNNNSSIAPPPTRSMAYFPPGQPSPTLGMMQPPPPGPGLSSTNVPRRGRYPVENPGLLRTGSPTMRVVEPSPEPDDRGQLPSARPRSRLPSFTGPNPPHPVSRQQQQQQQHWQQQQYWQQQQQRQVPQQQQPYPVYPSSRPISHRYPPFPPTNPPLHRINTQQPPLPPPPAVDSYQHSPSSARTDSTASSLLAKRLGTDRAANMALAGAPAGSDKWRRDEAGMLATPRRPGDLPSTPTWVPRLTPTRRGQDLVLNVQ